MTIVVFDLASCPCFSFEKISILTFHLEKISENGTETKNLVVKILDIMFQSILQKLMSVRIYFVVNKE